jgi:hypothetical protein
VRTENHKKKQEKLFLGTESITLLQGSRALPACPSGKGEMKMKTLVWYEVAA